MTLLQNREHENARELQQYLKSDDSSHCEKSWIKKPKESKVIK